MRRNVQRKKAAGNRYSGTRPRRQNPAHWKARDEQEPANVNATGLPHWCKWQLEDRTPNDAEPVVFRYTPTDDRLVLRRENDSWMFDGCGQRGVIGPWREIKTPDGAVWIIEPPQFASTGHRTIVYPSKPRRSLRKVLGACEAEVQGALASPELADERNNAVACVQVLSALAEAVERRDGEAEAFFERVEEIARRYLKKLWYSDVDRPTTRLASGGVNPVAERPAALASLVQIWFGYLTRDCAAIRQANAIGEEYIRQLRTGSFYALFASQLPKLASAGATEVAEIGETYRKAYAKIVRENKCRDCPSHARDWESPNARRPWGCANGPSCERLAESQWQAAQALVCRVAVTLGYPSAKARSLFDFDRAAWERESGKRTKPTTSS